jgi:hypothetical protein
MPYNWALPATDHPAHGIIDTHVLAAMQRSIEGVSPGETYTQVARSNDAALMATALQRILAVPA